MPLPDAAWASLLAASARADEFERHGVEQNLDFLSWRPGLGWISRLPADDPAAPMVDLYLPLCSASSRRPLTVGHLGQSLDGFIATPSGDSQFVTGEQNLLHMHRMRALSDAVVVGAGTVAADDPQLTTRMVEGPNALRVVFDPARRLNATFRIFADGAAPTIYVCAKSLVRPGETEIGRSEIVPFDDEATVPVIEQVIAILRGHGCARVFVEGGGVTVSAFLEANRLDRLHIAIAPMFIGEGRPAVRLAPHANLRDCRRPSYRVFRMGGDVLFDCDLQSSADPADGTISRVI